MRKINLPKQHRFGNLSIMIVALLILSLLIAGELILSIYVAEAQTNTTPTITMSKTVTPTPSEEWVISSSFGANLLDCTSAECKVVVFLETGTKVEWISSENGWFKVETVDELSGFVPDFLVSRLIDVTLTPTLVPTETGCNPRTDWPVYIVRSGDTLADIALRAHSSVQQLVEANCLANANFIFTGQALHVPVTIQPRPTNSIVVPPSTLIVPPPPQPPPPIPTATQDIVIPNLPQPSPTFHQ